MANRDEIDYITRDYREKADAYYSTSQLWDDGIIDPADNRHVPGISSSVTLNTDFQRTPGGILRI